MKSIKLWQVVVLLAVLVAGIGGAYGAYTLTTRTSQADLAEDQQLIPVTRGDLVNEVSLSGSLAYPVRESLNFGTQGTVGEILVEEGQAVSEGQPLARLDDDVVASLEKSVAQAQLDLRDAEEALAKTLNPHTALDITQADARVANSRLAVAEAEDTLAGLLEPTPQEVAQAEARVASSRLSLADATDSLAALLELDPQALAQAEAAVTSARLSVEDARSAFDALTGGPSDEDVAQAESAVTSAKISLDQANQALEYAKDGPSEDEIARATVAATSARSSAEDAKQALEETKGGPSEDDIAKAQSQIDSSATTLSNAQLDLKLAQKEWDGRVQAARDAADEASQGYKTVFTKWLGIELGDGDDDTGPDALFESWGVYLDILFSPDLRFDEVGRGETQGFPGDDPATAWNEAVVFSWVNFFPGTISVTCDDGEIPLEGTCIMKEMDEAWDTHLGATDEVDTVETQAAKAIANSEEAVTRNEEVLTAARDSLAELLTPADPLEIETKEGQLRLALATLQTAEEDLAELAVGADPLEVEGRQGDVSLALATLQTAEEDLAELAVGADPLEVEGRQGDVSLALANLERATEDLAELVGDPDPLEVEDRKSQLALAQANLLQRQEDLAELKQEPDPLEVDGLKKQAALAQAGLDEAVDDLAELTEGPTALEVEVERKDVAVALAGLAEAETDLAELKGGVDPLEVSLREAELASVQASLSEARERLEQTTIRAPWDGAVSAVSVDVGDQVNAATRVVEVVDPTVVEIEGIVDEIDVLFIRNGARASVTMDALPGQALAGSVSDIAAEPVTQQGVVSYPVSIQVQAPGGLQLPEGLSAVATVLIREDLAVLLVPIDSLYGTFEQPVVRVMSGGQVEDRAVTLGNSDNYWVIVEGGVDENEMIVLESRAASSGGAFGSFRALFGGGFGGGRPPGGGGRR